MPGQWGAFLAGLDSLVEERVAQPKPRPAPEPTVPEGLVASQAAPLNPPPRRKRGWPKGKPRGPRRPAARPSAFDLRLAQVRAIQPSPQPKPPLDLLGRPRHGRPKGGKNTPRPARPPTRDRRSYAEWMAQGPHEPTLLEAWLARHPDAPAELWEHVRAPEPPEQDDTEYQGRGRPRRTDQRKAVLPRECECGNPSIKLTGEDRRCQRCRDMEASQFHVGDTDDLMKKAYDPRWRKAGYVDRNNYRASPGVVPNLSPEMTSNPKLQFWIRAKGRLRASDIRQMPYGSPPPGRRPRKHVF